MGALKDICGDEDTVSTSSGDGACIKIDDIVATQYEPVCAPMSECDNSIANVIWPEYCTTSDDAGPGVPVYDKVCDDGCSPLFREVVRTCSPTNPPLPYRDDISTWDGIYRNVRARLGTCSPAQQCVKIKKSVFDRINAV